MVLMVDGPPPLTILSPTTSTTTTSTPMTFINLTEESSLDGLPPLVMTNATSTSTTSILPTPMQTDTSDAATEPEPEPEVVVPVASGSSRSKRYQCPACPYVTDSKTQFAYHKSFHRPRGDPYQCSECSYNVTKKHLLIQHQKTHFAPVSEVSKVDKPYGELSLVMGNETRSSGLTPAEILKLTKKMGSEVSIMPAITITSGASSSSSKPTRGQLVPKIVYYCANCPARYLDESEIVIHQNKHHQQDKYKCDLCSFSTCDESGIANHRNVHGINYRTATSELRRHNVESESHPRSRIISIRCNGDNQRAWVVKKDHEALQPPETDEPIVVDDPIVIEEDHIVIEDYIPEEVEEPVPVIEEPIQVEDSEPVLIEDPIPVPEETNQEEEPIQEEEPEPAPPTPPPPQKSRTPRPKPKEQPPRVRRSARVRRSLIQTISQPKMTRKSKQPKQQGFSCDHCDYTHQDEQTFKDHVTFHFRDILFPRRVDGVQENRGPFRQIFTKVHDPEQTFELTFNSDPEEDGEESGEEKDKIIVEIYTHPKPHVEFK